jgi:hypothetical protein
MGRPLSGVEELRGRIAPLTRRRGFTRLEKWNGEVASWSDDAILLDLDREHASRVWLPVSCCRLDGADLYVADWLLAQRERKIGDHQAAVARQHGGA